MSLRRAVTAGCVALLSAVLAACDADGIGEGSRPRATETSQEQEYPKAPPVANPLDATKYVEAPCSSLTESQQRAFNANSSRDNSNEDGRACVWNIGDGSTSISIAYVTSVNTGLSNLYALHATVPWPYFEETEVDGYPAVYQSVVDNRTKGACGLSVGITDELFFSADVRSRADAGEDACKAAANVAAAVVQTIKAGD